ncbi:lysyl oxidase homolog 2 [Ranitomeya variabilis]|uniref:lysyl oxidase homolog 2 n=1 Tax=Ranitomeya variabilis TaxID=490064 RepID=UPI004057BE20
MLVAPVFLCFLALTVPTLGQYEHWQYYPEYYQQQAPEPQPTKPPKEPPKIHVRLAGEKRKHNEGRVEVFYNGEWGTVCDDDFSLYAAHIVCRDLGYMEAVSWAPSSKYGKGEGHIWMDNVHCRGRERSIAECSHNGWGVTDCKHSEDVGVQCSDRRIPGFKYDNALVERLEELHIQVEDVRIRAILATYRKRIPVTEGYVEVKVDGTWKQVCDTMWTQKNSRVICGMFGFPGERKYNQKVYKMFATRKKHSYWQFSANCTGNEAHISTCSVGGFLTADTTSNQTCLNGAPAVVSCTPGRAFAPSPINGFRKAFRQEQPLVRLRGGANTGEGRVEVLKNNEWGTICDDRWNLVSASVVCRELGFGSAKEALVGAQLGQGMGHIHMSEIQCTGFEKSIIDCKFNTHSIGCNHEEDAAVRCNIPAMGFQNQVRLNGGRNPSEGRVEVLMDRNGTLQWGTVCSDNWGTMEAMIVCRQLGLGFASHAFQETWYWQGDVTADDVIMSGVKCSGTEMSLAHCRHDGPNINCPKGGGRFAAGVSCAETASDLVLNAPLVEQTTYLEDRPMFMLQCAHEERCLSSTADRTSYTTGYRRLLRFSSQIHNNGQADFRPKTGRHAWVWHECHRHYHSMEVFTHYDLLSLNGTKIAEGHKASFCLEDSECEADTQKQYVCANFGEQGISVGCWDVYRHDIDCQWIDITDVAPGDYFFQVIINPNQEVAESDYTNNVMKCRCRYDGQRVWMYNCHIGGSYSTETEEKFDQFSGLINNQLSAR